MKKEKTEVIGWKTAISRNGLSGPVKWLVKHGLIPRPGKLNNDERVLDFGCGRGKDADLLGYCEKYDPHWFPTKPQGKFNIVLCTYVLCVLPPNIREMVLGEIADLMTDEGSYALLSVRADLKKDSQPGNGCIQHDVILPKTIIRASGFRISMLTKVELQKMSNITSVGGFCGLTEQEYKRYFKYNTKE